MDKTDIQIIESLKENARKPYTKVAEEIGTSEGTVRNRVEKMVDEDMIKFTLSTRLKGISSMIEIKVDSNTEISKISEEIIDWNNIDFVWKTSGKNDIIAATDTKDTERLNKIVTKIRNLESIVSINTRIILEKKI